MAYQHAIVWLDHQHAIIIDFSFDDDHIHLVMNDCAHRDLRRRDSLSGRGHLVDEFHHCDHRYFDEIVVAVGDSRDLLLVGPGAAKQAFHLDLEHRHGGVADRVRGVEQMHHAGPGEMLAYARRYFKHIDALRRV